MGTNNDAIRTDHPRLGCRLRDRGEFTRRAQERLAIKGGKVLPVAGPPIEDGIVLIRNGKIEAVGKDVAIPSDAKVIDATGKVVVPGFIEAHSNRGTDRRTRRTRTCRSFRSSMRSIRAPIISRNAAATA